MEYVYSHIWWSLGIMAYVILYIRAFILIKEHEGSPRTRGQFLLSVFWSSFAIIGLIGFIVDVIDSIDWLNKWLDKDTKL